LEGRVVLHHGRHAEEIDAGQVFYRRAQSFWLEDTGRDYTHAVLDEPKPHPRQRHDVLIALQL
jgi:hypothetical protein